MRLRGLIKHASIACGNEAGAQERAMIRIVAALVLLLFSVAAQAQQPAAKTDPQNTVYLDTKDGRIVIRLRPDLAPKHAERIKLLVREKFYDNVPFHRVTPGFLAQTGDGQFGNGMGSSQYPNLPAEFSNVPFKRGIVGMARKGGDANSGNSQFFIMLAEAPHMNGKYTVVGEVISGMDVVDKIKTGSPETNGLVSNPDIIVRMMIAKLCGKSNYQDCGSPRVVRRKNTVAPPAPSARNGVVSTGTGFFVSENGHIVTNAHVVDGCEAVRSSRGGSLRKVSTDNEFDLALYIASEKPDTIARVHGGRGARVGEAVVTVGFPLTGLLSSDPIVTTGTISALSGLGNDRRQIQISAPVQPGNSGGPLLGENGSVVGVVVGKINALKVAKAIGDIPQNINFAVSLGTLQSFLNANGVDYVLDDSKKTKSPADIAAEASRYTVFLECLR